jgi:murein DD-endopeptidase MepM/ murein hydrolase activator NlpD
LEYLRQVSGVDESVVDQLRSYRDELDRQTSRLGEALDEQVVLAAELEGLAGELQEDLIAAQQFYDDLVRQQAEEEAERLRQEEERRRREGAAAAAAAVAAQTSNTQAETAGSSGTTATSGTAGGSESTTTTAPPPTSTTSPAAPPPTPSGNGACPVAGAVSFSDTWGDPRSGGRSHQGVDMIAARGTPIVAIFSGRINRFSTSSLGGNSIYFTSDAGELYYYAHLDSYADVGAGQSVPAGTVIGYNGSSGNAPDWLPHLHFEYHPGGGAAVNPYPLVKSLCG